MTIISHIWILIPLYHKEWDNFFYRFFLFYFLRSNAAYQYRVLKLWGCVKFQIQGNCHYHINCQTLYQELPSTNGNYNNTLEDYHKL